MPDTILVAVRDRAKEAPRGSGPTSPCVRVVRIAATCPCGGPRGEARHIPQHDDGASYWVDVWENPCGHLDRYADVLQEAEHFDAPAANAQDGGPQA